MDLRDFPYKRSYTRGIDNPLNDFLLPVLKFSDRFYYISGYFSSKLISLLSYGIKDFIINNKGIIKLIVGQFFSAEIKVLNMSNEDLEEKFIEVSQKDFFSSELEKEQGKIEPLKLLAWLLYNKRIFIKWGIPIDPINGIVEDSGILHEKIGILRNKKIKKEDFVTFSGSANATYYAWVKNREELKVFKSWDEKSSGYAHDDFKKFHLYWHNPDPYLIILDFPLPLKKKIIAKYLPKSNNINEIDFEKIDVFVQNELKKEVYWKIYEDLQQKEDWIYREGCLIRNIDRIEPFQHQQRALEFLKDRNYSGFLQMATGSGKTKAAILASYQLYQELVKNNQKLLTIVLVPDSYLVDQWYNELELYTKNVVKCYSSNPECPQQVNTKISRLKINAIDHAYIIGTSRTLNSRFWLDRIIKPLNTSKDRIRVLLIGDEAHSLGAPTGIFLIENIELFLNSDFKIGLSATPIREYDTEGTKKILDFFSNEVTNDNIFKYELKEAQEDNRLMKFNYSVGTCELNDDDFEEFIKLSLEIGTKMGEADTSLDFESKKKKASNLTILLNQRADILKKTENKLTLLEDLLMSLLEANNLYHTVIFCRDGVQVSDVESVIVKINKGTTLLKKIRYNTVDGSDPNPRRLERFNELASKEINLIIVMNCLNQGVDIPTLSRGIFMSSSGTELEHVQRAGRLLRKAPEKIDPVELYDFVVFPSSEQIEENLMVSRKIFSIEEKRLDFFKECAENQEDIQDLLFDLEDIFED